MFSHEWKFFFVKTGNHCWKINKSFLVQFVDREFVVEVLFVFWIRVTKFLLGGPQENDDLETAAPLLSLLARKKLSSGGLRLQRGDDDDGQRRHWSPATFQSWVGRKRRRIAHTLPHTCLKCQQWWKITKCQNQQPDKVRFSWILLFDNWYFFCQRHFLLPFCSKAD